MRVQVKLIILFVAGWLLVAMLGFGINVFLQKRYDEQKLQQKKDQIEEVSEKIQNELYNIRMQVWEQSVSDEINMFNMYNWEKDSAYIYEESKALYKQLQRIALNNECLDGAWLIFGKQNRQITDKIRYGVIDRDMYEMFLSADSGFVLDGSTIYYVSWISTSQ